MTINQNAQLDSQKVFGSIFLTTRRNEVLDHLANVIIYPAYIICAHHLIEWVTGLVNTNFKSSIHLILWCLTLLPFLNIAAANIEWRLGFKRRGWAYSVSLILINVFLQKSENLTLNLFMLTLGVISFEFILRRLMARRRFKHSKLNISIAFSIAGLTLLALLVFGWPALVNIIDRYTQNRTALYRGILFFCIFVSGVIPFIELVTKRLFTQVLPSNGNDYGKNLFGLVALIFLLIVLRYLNSLFVISLLGTLSLVGATIPRQLTSRQAANLASILQFVRHDYVRKLVSPTQSPTSAIGFLFDHAKHYVRRNTHWLILFTCLATGGLIIPFVVYTNDPATQFIGLVTVGIVSSFTLAVIYLIFWFVRHRPKHIVIPFVALNDEKDPNLKALAYLTTQMFVERLRQITLLLNMRQVENLSLRNDTGLALFVTSGQDQELVEQVRSLGNIDAGNVKLPFGNVLAYFMTLLAHTRVRGTIQRQDDHTVAIWVEFTQRNGRTVAVDMALIPEDSVQDIDQINLDEIVYILAVKLIIRLGHNAHLASSWESLKHFLDGLDAAYHRNWRHAIACYRKAIHIEETARGSFGYGYYHLGASLMFQGEVIEGLKYLEIAETVGPPLAETQYMIALALFYLYRDILHVERVTFMDIEWRCKTAIALQPGFAEAHHLLGTIYYQRGHLREHVHTSDSPEKEELLRSVDPNPQNFSHDYNRARYHLLKSMRLYDGKIRYLPNDMLALSTVFDEHTRLVQDRMSATHRLADALRSLERYSEATVYYRETLAAFPLNARTLVDLAKTYCLAGNWGKADEFLRNEVFNHEEMKWNKSASLYMGWTQIGGLADRLDTTSRIVDFIIELYATVTNGNWNKQSNTINEINKSILSRATTNLDFALHQYPEYVYRWRQIDWFPDFEKATRLMAKKTPKPECHQIYNAPINSENEYYVWHIGCWLFWRVLSYFSWSDRRFHNLMKFLFQDFDPSNVEYPHPPYGKTYEIFQKVRAVYIRILEDDNLPHSINSVERKFKCLELGAEIYEQWLKANELFSQINEGTSDVIFGHRWAIDVYCEISLLTAKILIEANAFEFVEEVTSEAGNKLTKWINQRNLNFNKDDKFMLSYKVLQYQLSSLYSWCGYSSLMQTQDVATYARNIWRKSAKSSQQLLVQTESALIKATRFMKYNPLALYTRALLCQKHDLSRQAADELNRLTTLIAPFDPHKFLSLDNIHSEPRPGHENDARKVDDLARHLYYQERVSGRRQIDTIVNPMQIHLTLAGVLTEIGDVKLATDQVLIALSKSYYPATTTEGVIQLVFLLNQQNRFQEAITATEDAKNQRLNLSPFNLATVKCLEPFVLECILNNSIERYHLTIQNADRIKEQLGFPHFIGEHKQLIKECLGFFKASSTKLFYKLISNYQNLIIDMEKVYGQQVTIGQLSKLAAQCVRADLLAESLKGNKILSSRFDPEIIFASQLIYLLSKDLYDFIVYRCDIRSNSALSLAELCIDLEKAQFESNETTNMMQVLFDAIFEQKKTEDYVTTSNTRQFVVDQAPITQFATHLQIRLAHYHDTQAWVLYRKGDTKSIQDACHILTKQVLHSRAEVAIFHYHLARVYITQLEQLWQGLSPLSRSNADVTAEIAERISTLLRLSFLHWRHAHRLDANQALYLRLRLARQRINVYRERWAQLLVTPSMKKDA